MVKQISWGVKTDDMKYHATMAKNEGLPLTQIRKRNVKAFVSIMFAFFSCFFPYKIIIDLHGTGQTTHLNLFNWLFNNALQRESYVELR